MTDIESATGVTHQARVRRRLSAFLTVAFVVMLAFAPSAAAGGMVIVDFEFQPAKSTISQGSAATWTNAGSFTHSVTSDMTDTASSRLDYWPRHDFAPGTNFTITFPAAGTFFYHCSFHTFMHGKIKVPFIVSNVGRTVTMTSSTVELSPTSAFRYVVLYRVDGGGWFTLITRHGSESFLAPQAGTYEFVSAVKRRANGAMSGWSKIARLTIS